MKNIKLNCRTLGKFPGDILTVGPKAEIPLEEAQVLVDEKLAVEYNEPVVESKDSGELKARIKELEGQVASLTTKNTELEGQVASLTTKNTELEGQVALLTPPPADAPKK